ncbi:MAG: universal stress protein [Acidimicrobiales bacterium]
MELRPTEVVAISGPASLRLENDKGAGLIVVGSRGRSSVKATILGSVSHQVSLHGTCPVVVVPDGST